MSHTEEDPMQATQHLDATSSDTALTMEQVLSQIAQRLTLVEQHLSHPQAQQAQPPPQAPTPLAANSSSTMRPVKPETFAGNRDDSVDNFTFQLDNYFSATNTHEADPQRVYYAATCLRGHALNWWRAEAPNINLHQYSWAQFKQDIKWQFKPVSSEVVARDKLAVVKQRNSVAAYTHEFRNIVLDIPNISKEEKIDRYKRGLKWNIRKEVELREITEFNDIVRIATRLDTMEWNYHRQANNQPPTHDNAPTPSTSSPAPMELGAIQHRPNNRRPSGPCWFCHEPGHIAVNCPTKKKSWLESSGNAHRQ